MPISSASLSSCESSSARTSPSVASMGCQSPSRESATSASHACRAAVCGSEPNRRDQMRSPSRDRRRGSSAASNASSQTVASASGTSSSRGGMRPSANSNIAPNGDPSRARQPSSVGDMSMYANAHTSARCRSSSPSGTTSRKRLWMSYQDVEPSSARERRPATSSSRAIHSPFADFAALLRMSHGDES